MTPTVNINTPLFDKVKLPTVLTVAGSDPSGGAGIEADLKTITAHGCYGMTCITALTVQNTQGVKGSVPTSMDTLNGILAANFEDINVDVVKTGMLTLDAINSLDLSLEKWHKGKLLVVDPVMVATTGSRLGGEGVLKLCVDKLFKRATLITPNIPEAEELLALFDIQLTIKTTKEMVEAAELIHQCTGALNVLLKGGHSPHKGQDGTSYLTDVLYRSSDKSSVVFQSEFIDTENTHGTGCALASAISSNLANGHTLLDAVQGAIRYIHNAIASASKIGHGNGPLNHVYHIVAPSSIPESPSSFVEGHFVDYLLSHPLIKPVWDQYVNHPFVAQLACGDLPFEKFIQFISQDYPYLVNYARVHSLAASVAPDVECIEREIVILTEIKHEMSQHVKRLGQHGITNVESVEMSPACKTYTDYLLTVAKGGDWLEIKVALSPCLFGYYHASKNVEANGGIPNEYKEWLEAYTSEWYFNAVKKGEETLERHSMGISIEKTKKLVQIFADVCLLEVDFWSEALGHK